MNIKAIDVVNQAKAWIGRKESNGSHREIIDIYNSQSSLPRGYKMKYNDAWCAAFVSAIAVKLECTDIIPTECSCPKMIDKLKSLGCWVENENRSPKIGDIVFYDWDDSDIGDNTGSADHVGIVTDINDNYFIVTEGNYNNAVAERKLKINTKYLRGFGVPKYFVDADDKQITTIEVVAKDVIEGLWGNGSERKEKLIAAGYDYDVIQTHVNYLLKTGKKELKPIREIALEVIRGEWGNGSERKEKLTAAGYDYDVIQADVRDIL